MTGAQTGRARSMAERADKYALYRLAVQDPEREVDELVRFYVEAYGRSPTTLREDFCAAAAVSCAWARSSPARSAVGIDLDPEPLAHCRTHELAAMTEAERARVTLVNGDVLASAVGADVIAAQNYSFYVFKTRALVRRYFEAVHRALPREGVFVMDVMGGGAMHDEAVEESRAVARPSWRDKRDNPPFRYVWRERSFNPITNDAVFEIDFRFPDGSALERAFAYDWRLWSIPELRELLEEAGFAESHVYWDVADEYRRETKVTPDLAWLAYLVALR